MSDSTTTAAPAAPAPPPETTAAPPNQSTAAPADPAPTTTVAPSNQSTSAPGAATTAAPGGSTTAGPGGSTTAHPGSTTTAGGNVPTVTAVVEIDPADGTAQNPNSVEVSKDAKLTLTWNATNAASVNITGIGDGQQITGSQSIPTADGQFTLVAVGDDGTQSSPFVVNITTHDGDDAVSPHSDLDAGVAAVISFTATGANGSVTHANIGDEVTLNAVVSVSTDSCQINGQDAGLSDAGGNKAASVTVTIADGMTGDFSCEVSYQGTGGNGGSLHIDIGPAGASTTTTEAPGMTTTANPNGTTTAPGGSTTMPGTTTTLPPSSTTAPGSTTTAPGSTTTATPSTTTTGGDVPVITLQIVDSKGKAPEEGEPVEITKGANAGSITWQISNNPTSVTITGQADNQTAGSISLPWLDGQDGGTWTFAASNAAGEAEQKTVAVKYTKEDGPEISIAELGCSASGSTDNFAPDPFSAKIAIACEGTFNLMMVPGNEAQQSDVQASVTTKLANLIPSSAILSQASSGSMSGGWGLSGFKAAAKGSNGEYTLAQFQLGKWAFNVPDFEGKGEIEESSISVTVSAITLSMKEGDALIAPIQGTLEIPLVADKIDIGVQGFRLDGKIAVKLTLTGGVSLKDILEDAAKDVAEDVATVIGIDAIIAGSFVLGGVATIGAAILTIAEGDEIAELSGRCKQLADQMSAGYTAGVTGQPSPGSDAGTQKGYQLGAQNYNAALQSIQSQNTSKDAATIQQAVQDAAAKGSASAAATITSTAQRTVWESYANAHQDSTFHSYESDRWMAWSNIYGYDPNGDPEFMKFQNSHSENKHGQYGGGTKTDHTK